MRGELAYYVREGWRIAGEQADAGLYDTGVDHGGLVRTPASADAPAAACTAA